MQKLFYLVETLELERWWHHEIEYYMKKRTTTDGATSVTITVFKGKGLSCTVENRNLLENAMNSMENVFENDRLVLYR